MLFSVLSPLLYKVCLARIEVIAELPMVVSVSWLYFLSFVFDTLVTLYDVTLEAFSSSKKLASFRFWHLEMLECRCSMVHEHFPVSFTDAEKGVRL